MTDKLLDKTAKYLKNNPLLIAWWFVLILGFIAAVWLSIEDYLGSVRGYDSLTTAPITGITRNVVGLLPQIGQLILSLLILNAIGMRISIWAMIAYIVGWLMLFGIDAYTDYLYLIGLFPTDQTRIEAVIQAIVLYTFGSEWLFMITAGLLFRVSPDAVRELTKFLKNMGDAGTDFVATIGNRNDDDEPETRVRNAQNRQPEETRLPPSRRN
jgi:hypothetical protein